MRLMAVAALTVAFGLGVAGSEANAMVATSSLGGLKAPAAAPSVKVLFWCDHGYWWYRSHYGRSYHRHHHRHHHAYRPLPPIK